MYCPKCLNDSITIKNSGVIEILINDKKMDAGRFLYNRNDQNQDKIYRDAHKKLDNFLNWLSGFSNREPLNRIQFVTTDVACEDGCSVGLTKVSVVGNIIPLAKAKSILAELGPKHKMELKLES